MRFCLSLAAALLLAGSVALADDAPAQAPPKKAPAKASPGKAAPADALTTALRAFFAEPDAGKRAAAGLGIAMQHPDARAVAAAIPLARTWPTGVKTHDVIRWKSKTADGVEHSIFAAIPEAYDAKKAWPVLIWLHGAVSRPVDGGGISGLRTMAQVAEEEGFLLLAPSAQAGSAWWTPNGVALVHDALDELKRRFHVDADRVAVAGFSDGASGCFHLLAHDPEPYACFLALMAHPGVTRMAGGPSFVANVRSRPVFAVNGGQDTLYPSPQIKPLIDQLKAAGCDLTWLALPEAGHRIADVLPEHWDKVRDFWHAHPRKPLAKHIAWETALPEREGRFGWVEILGVDAKAPSAKGAAAAVLPDPAGRPVLGVRIDTAFAGPGLKISRVEEGSAAEDAGFEVGDVILAVDGTDLGDAMQSRRVLAKSLPAMAAAKKAGVFRVQRGEDEVDLTCLPRAAGMGKVKRPADRGYGLPSGRIEARVMKGNRIDVTTWHVGRFRLHLADGLVDLTAPLHVYVNGALKFEGLARGTTGYVLDEAVRGGPGAPLFRASLLLRP